jgi:hypothetical protein
MILHPDEFRRSLPTSPYVDHLCQVYSVLIYMYGRGDGHDVNAVKVAAHSLRTIAVGVAPPEWLKDGIREEVLRDLGLPPGTTSAIANPFEALGKVLQQMRVKIPKQPLDGLNERTSELRFQRKIERERTIGLAFVRAEARRVEQELGLTHQKTGSK